MEGQIFSILEKADDFRKYISEYPLFFIIDMNRDGSLEVPQAKATRYDDNLFGKELISLPERDQLNITIISLV